MKYLNTMVTFSEFPDEISLCINITGCKFHCPGCHSPELWNENKGKDLSQRALERLISENEGITCVGFMGGQPDIVNMLAERVYNLGLKVGWYWGGDSIPKEIDIKWFDYIKIGPYIKEKGGLDNPNTNQRFYAKGSTLHKMDANSEMLYDVTYKFWKHGTI